MQNTYNNLCGKGAAGVGVGRGLLENFTRARRQKANKGEEGKAADEMNK